MSTREKNKMMFENLREQEQKDFLGNENVRMGAENFLPGTRETGTEKSCSRKTPVSGCRYGCGWLGSSVSVGLQSI